MQDIVFPFFSSRRGLKLFVESVSAELACDGFHQPSGAHDVRNDAVSFMLISRSSGIVNRVNKLKNLLGFGCVFSLINNLLLWYKKRVIKIYASTTYPYLHP